MAQGHRRLRRGGGERDAEALRLGHRLADVEDEDLPACALGEAGEVHAGHGGQQRRRARLRQGDVISGPAIITEMDATTLVEHDCCAVVDAVGNILITLKAKG